MEVGPGYQEKTGDRYLVETEGRPTFVEFLFWSNILLGKVADVLKWKVFREGEGEDVS